jgi:small-conductance mechanosensitive channel
MRWKYRTRCIAVLILGLLAPAPARAQTAPQPPTTEQLQQLVGTLKDDKARAQLVDQLQALIAAQNATQKPKPQSPLAWFSDLPAALDAVGGEVLSAIPIFAQAPRSVAWLQAQISDPQLRQHWIDIFAKLAAIFGAAIAADAVTYLLLRRVRARFKETTGNRRGTRAFLLAAAAFVEILPVLMFAGIATFVMPLTEPRTGTRGVAEVIIAATLWARGLLAIARITLLAPRAPPPPGLTEETRNYLYIWIRRFIHWGAYGYAASAGAWWLTAPAAIVGLLMRVSVLVLAIMALIFVLQNRVAVANWLRGTGREGGRSGWRVVWYRLADTWHILAIVYIIGTFGVYMLNAEGGLALLLRATALSIVVITGAALLSRLLEQALQRGLAVKPELKERFPGLEPRVNRYTPILRIVGSLILYVVTGLALLQAWGLDAFAWIASLAQHPATGHMVSLALVIVAGLILWEVFSSMIERHLATIDHKGRSRARTFLPLLRSTILIILVTLIGLMVLSELGLNIAPLLAGAGIAGIAVGFGAQALVKDVITGFFILVEDTFAVGDLVDVGKGHVGMIEAISIRNFRLRDGAGIVHTVPFSEVTSVLNMSRDYAYVMCDAGVVYREDPDRVVAVMREVGKELAEDTGWSRYILAPLEILGVEKFTDFAMVIRARLKAAPPHQLELGREFNRRLKRTFDARGIELASANQVNYVAQLQKPMPAATVPAEPRTQSG